MQRTNTIPVCSIFSILSYFHIEFYVSLSVCPFLLPSHRISLVLCHVKFIRPVVSTASVQRCIFVLMGIIIR